MIQLQYYRKPQAYFITGHRGAGKTIASATILGGVKADLFQFNDRLHEATDANILDQDIQKYLKAYEQALHDVKAYIEKCTARQEDILIEVDGAAFHHLHEFEQLIDGNYDVRKTVLLCDNYEESFELSKFKCDALGTPLHLDYKSSYERTNFFINYSPVALTGYLDIYTSDGRNHHLASFDNGEAIFAIPRILNKSWLSPDSQLRPEIQRSIIDEEKRRIERLNKEVRSVDKKTYKGKTI